MEFAEVPNPPIMDAAEVTLADEHAAAAAAAAATAAAQAATESGGAAPGSAAANYNKGYTNRAPGLLDKCLGKWRPDDAAAMEAHEAKGLKGLQTAPFGIWKEWLDAHPAAADCDSPP